MQSKLQTIEKLFLYFLMAAIIGWCYEVFLEVVVYRWGFQNRGVLFGPYCPVYGVGMLAFLLAVVSVILFAPVFLEYLNTGLVPRFPTLIACGFILLAGIQSFFSGMMLDVMAAKDRKDFEYRLNRVHGEHQERKGL